MTLEDIASELMNLDIDFALVTRERPSGLGAEELRCSLDSSGLPRHSAADAWLLPRGVQIALNLCDFDPAWAANISAEITRLKYRLLEWRGFDESRAPGEDGS